MRKVDDGEEEQTTVMGGTPAPDVPVVVPATTTDPIDHTRRRSAVAVSHDFASGQFRTRFASSAVSLAEQFNVLVGSRPVGGSVRFRLELATPDGPSTGGGAQALQHIKLVPADGGATLVVGWCNPVEHTAELRSLAYLDADHRLRFSRSSLTPPPMPSARIDGVHYTELLSRLRTFCVEQDFDVKLSDTPPATTAVRAPKSGATAPMPASVPMTTGRAWWLAVLLLVAVTLVMALFARTR